jgi:hypothetical protein
MRYCRGEVGREGKINAAQSQWHACAHSVTSWRLTGGAFGREVVNHPGLGALVLAEAVDEAAGLATAAAVFVHGVLCKTRCQSACHAKKDRLP